MHHRKYGISDDNYSDTHRDKDNGNDKDILYFQKTGRSRISDMILTITKTMTKTKTQHMQYF